ncbi:MLO-like protein 12 [Cornus florida]|uniref:MLO-like protein 12 n=1 Tax=Cornus florida TaxID=4283 RepID=UPI00289CF41B|nr:MLO-like protein 12 [Cornus florida]
MVGVVGVNFCPNCLGCSCLDSNKAVVGSSYCSLQIGNDGAVLTERKEVCDFARKHKADHSTFVSKVKVGNPCSWFYNYYWLPFIPLAIAMVVGTKLEVVITKMCLESYKRNAVILGAFPVKPNDELFWFRQPKWLLHLIQFILIQILQNSFQLAFFTWTWYEYGLRSCFNREDMDIALRIATGVIAQFLCGYVTLPLYALVTQMGSNMKKAVFSDLIIKGLKNWHKLAKRNISRNRSSVIISTDSWPIDSTETSSSDRKSLYNPKVGHLPPLELMLSPSQEITEETTQHYHIPPAVTSLLSPEITEEKTPHKIVARGTYDGEISFASNWKDLVSGKGSEDISLSSV